jgi:hypothetical protein
MLFGANEADRKKSDGSSSKQHCLRDLKGDGG